MNKNKKVIILISIISAIVVLAGITYAYYTSGIVGSEKTSTINLTSGDIEIEVDGGNSITAQDFIPDSGTPFATKKITLTAKNTTNLKTPYTIRLVVDNNTFSSGAIKYSLTGEDKNTPNNGELIPNTTLKEINTSSYLGNGYFENGTNLIHEYTLKLYFPETGTDQSIDMGKAFKAHIEVAGKPVNAPDGWYNAGDTTLLANIKKNTALNTDDSALTKPGQEIATEDEGLRVAEDDYGTSYYYRGAVENNYVVFAKMCWRIVRIDGQGNIKLVLYNYNSDKENVTNPCSVTGTSLAFARYDGDTYKSAFNENSDKNTYVGYMYSNTPDSEDYLEAHANDNDSTILSNLKTWYDANFSNTQKNLLADTIWCNDKRLADVGYEPGPDTETDYLNTGLGTQKTAYASAQRLVSDTGESWTAKTDTAPTLKCGNTKEDNIISKFTAQDAEYGNAKLYTTENGTTKYYKIGLLTADEIAYAGGVYNQENKSYYLRRNASNTYWWSLSPFRFDGSYAGVFLMYPSGVLYNNYVRYTSRAVRPAVSLNYNVSATYNTTSEYQPGTANNPYVISED